MKKNTKRDLPTEIGRYIDELVVRKSGERLIALDVTGKKLFDQATTKSHMKTSFQPKRGVVLLHNHPKPMAHSAPDVYDFINKPVILASIVVDRGVPGKVSTVWWLSKRDLLGNDAARLSMAIDYAECAQSAEKKHKRLKGEARHRAVQETALRAFVKRHSKLLSLITLKVRLVPPSRPRPKR